MENRIEEFMETSGNEISIFRLLEPEERRKLAVHFEPVHYPAGTILHQEGEKINHIGIIYSGKLNFERQRKITGKPITLAILERGAHIGGFSMTPEREVLGRLRAIEDTELLVISHARLDAFMREHPHTGIKILKGINTILTVRLKSAIDQVVLLS